MGRQTFKNIITAEELMEKINGKNQDLANKFLKEKAKYCSEATIKNYRSDLNIFFCWNVDNNNNKI